MNPLYIFQDATLVVGCLIILLAVAGVIMVDNGKQGSFRKYHLLFVSIGVFAAFFGASQAMAATGAAASNWYVLNEKGCTSLPVVEPRVSNPDDIVQKFQCSVVKRQALGGTAQENYYHLDCQERLKVDLILINGKDLCEAVYASQKKNFEHEGAGTQ